jgi:hypothetical protein
MSTTIIPLNRPGARHLTVQRDGAIVVLKGVFSDGAEDSCLMGADLLGQLAYQDLVRTSSMPLVRVRSHDTWGGDAIFLLFSSRVVVVRTADLAKAARIRL